MTKDPIVFIILVLPISGILMGIWYLQYQKKQSNTVQIVLGGILILMTGLLINRPYFQPMILPLSDIVGQYVIDTSKYPGPNANWHNEHYRFTIHAVNKMIFESKTDENHWSKEVLPISYSSGYYDLEINTLH